jgi:DNA-binding NarL/FixJ family response regulator
MSHHALIVDEDRSAAAQVRAVLKRAGVSVSVATSFLAARTLAGEHRPDLLVADIDIGRSGGGIGLAALIKASRPMAIVFLAGGLPSAALDAIAAIDTASIVRKPLDERQLEATISLALRRHELTSRRAVPGAGFSGTGWADRLAVLGAREREVVSLLLDHDVHAIAEELGISRQAVRNHLKAAFKRTGTRSQSELLDWMRKARVDGMARLAPRATAMSAAAAAAAAG